MFRILLLACVLSGGCAPCRTPTNTTTVAAAKDPKKQPGTKLVCRRERVMGSHMRKRVCRYEGGSGRRREATQRQVRQLAPNPPRSPEDP